MKYILFVLAGACSFGLLSTFVKKAYESGFNVGDVVGSQNLFGVIMLWLLVFVTAKSAKQSTGSPTFKVTKRQALSLMAVGTTTGLTGMLYYAALQYISASFAIILLFQFTWMGILLEAIVERKRPGKDKILSLVILFVGIIMASGYLGGGQEAISWIGVTLGLLAAVTYALFIWFSGKTAKQVAPITRSAIMLTGSFILVMLVFPPHFLFSGSLHEALLPWALLLALFGVVIPPLFYAIGVPRIGGGLATILSAAELPTAVIMSYVVLNESVNWLQWLGVGITMFGIALPELMKRKKGKSVVIGANVGA
ncbi:EamA family transporter [Paenibacillus alginolyticus]|uniref:DMT family transporter n=1 Tax=Paenibacillus alginolyticus TaxID=59839 RepID=A0ABT4G696_9BACL|nr:DMT family transporter [Paenibacillus alginolyticus]MCY9691690.1 DMT family transporter [Paenibacillus alginolyticus]MEC0146874.1 DMT family transporter [Paenibacillus alginolyticus]